MKRSNKIFLTTLLATGIATAAVVSAAPGYGPGGCQQGYGPGSGPMMQGEGYGQGGGRHGRMQQGQRDPAAFEQRLDGLHDKLAITAEQEPAWQAFRDQAKVQGERMRAHRETMRAQWSQSETLTAPERIRRRSEMMSERLAAMNDMTTTMESLYGQLMPEQQKKFDQMPMGRQQKRGF